jgi:hypothetical protein
LSLKKIHLAALEESQLLVDTTCTKETADSIADYRGVMITVGAKINKKNVEIFKNSRGEIMRVRGSVRDAVRKELTIDGKS